MKNILSALYKYNHLFVNGKLAQQRVMPIKSNLKLDRVFCDPYKKRVIETLKLRNSRLDFSALCTQWNSYSRLREQNQKFLKQKNLLKAQYKSTELEIELAKFYQEYKNFKVKFDAEEMAFIQAYLDVPNVLGQNPSVQSVSSIFLDASSISNEPRSAFSLLMDAQLIKPSSDGRYFFLGDAAVLERTLIDNLTDFCISSGLSLHSNPDTVKTVVLECVGKTIEDPEVIKLRCGPQENSDGHARTNDNPMNQLSIVGSSSIYAFCGYLANMLVTSDRYLPLKLFNIGRCYAVTNVNQVSHPLCCDVVVISLDSETSIDMIERLMITIFENLKLGLRVTRKSVAELEQWESVKNSYEVYNYISQQYDELGFIVDTGDYITSRMNTQYCETQGKLKNFHNPNLVYARLMDVEQLLMKLIERQYAVDGFLDLKSIIKGLNSSFKHKLHENSHEVIKKEFFR